MSFKLHLICKLDVIFPTFYTSVKREGFHAKIRCNLNNISYLSETQKNNFQF